MTRVLRAGSGVIINTGHRSNTTETQNSIQLMKCVEYFSSNWVLGGEGGGAGGGGGEGGGEVGGGCGGGGLYVK